MKYMTSKLRPTLGPLLRKPELAQRRPGYGPVQIASWQERRILHVHHPMLATRWERRVHHTR